MIHCAKLHSKMLNIPCLIRQEHPAFESCHTCVQGIVIRDAIYWIEGREIKPINIKPNQKRVSIQMRQGGRHKQTDEERKAKKAKCALRYYHEHKVLKGPYKRREFYTPEQKTCTKCGETFTEDLPKYFYREAKCYDGFRGSCKKCDGKKRAENARKWRGEK